MNRNEYEEWVSRNVGKGGKRPSLDLFNRAKKGRERNPTAPEYPCRDVEEYHQYYERSSQKRADDEQKKQQESTQGQSQSGGTRRNNRRNGNGRNLAQSVAKQLASKVALVVVGGLVIVSAYQAMEAKKATPASAAIVSSSSWTWEADHSAASVELFDEDGDSITVLLGSITSTSIEPTCVEDGLVTYIASASYQEETYTDDFEEVIPALGHDFLEPIRTDHEDHYDLDYECDRCHEHFVVSIAIGEIYDISELLPVWNWAEDHSSATLSLYDPKGGIVADSLEAMMGFSQKEATCVEEGASIYEAKVVYEEKTFASTYSDPIPALGHDLLEPIRTDHEDHYDLDYECDRCHEHFVVSIAIEEE